jgi:hypothetical protein
VSAWALHEPGRSNIPALLIVLAAITWGAGLVWRLWRGGQVWSALVWNGAAWFLERTKKNGAMTVIAQPSIRFDGQRWLLLRARAGRCSVWLWLGRSIAPARWHALRCALYARAAEPQA